MCDYCTDLRNIEPAYSVFIGDEEGNLDPWLQKARDEKRFLSPIYDDGGLVGFRIVEKCPSCNYLFTEKDYNNSRLE